MAASVALSSSTAAATSGAAITSTTTPSSSLQRKVHQVLSSRVRVDSPEITQALKGLSDLYSSSSNTTASRRRLRSLLERRAVHNHQSLCNAFITLQHEMEQTDALISDLASTCTQISTRLAAARSSTKYLLDETTRLQNEKIRIATRQQIVTTFLERFQLTSQQLAALEPDAPVSDDLFSALSRIGQIRSDCKELLQTYHQRVGLDIMDALAKRLEQGYEKLYRWVQKEASTLSKVTDVTNTFVTAFALLKQMPVYFDHCCGEIGQSRRLHLIGRFMKALTRGGVNGTPRPIEMHAHDPIRYVSDMFAWIHQAIASERDFLLTIFTLPENRQDTKPQLDATNHVEASTLLGQVLEGIARPFKLRVEQSLASNTSPEIGFKLVNVLEFYASIITPLLPEQAVFRVTLSGLCEHARTRFFELLQKQADKLIRTPPPYTHDLSPPRVITEQINQLTQIMTIYQSSLVSSAQKEQDFAPVLSAILNPILEAVRLSCAELDQSDAAVYHINVLNAIQSCLRHHDFTRSRIETLALLCDQHIETLVTAQSSVILRKCGLADIVAIIQQWQMNPERPPLSTVPGMDLTTITHAIRTFYGSLVSVGAFVIPQCDRILNSQIRRACRQAIARSISIGYAIVYQLVSDPSNGYGDVRKLFQHTPAQIDVLLELPVTQSMSTSTPIHTDVEPSTIQTPNDTSTIPTTTTDVDPSALPVVGR